MKEITAYKALDGEIFENASDCEAHERIYYAFPDSFKIYDIDMYELRMPPVPGDYTESEIYDMAEGIYNRAWYVILKGGPGLQNDIERMHDVFGYFPDIPEDAEPGLYQYIGEHLGNSDWEKVNLDQEQENCEATMVRIAALRNLIKEANDG